MVGLNPPLIIIRTVDVGTLVLAAINGDVAAARVLLMISGIGAGSEATPLCVLCLRPLRSTGAIGEIIIFLWREIDLASLHAGGHA
jgi:hypothetical protein